MAPKKTEVSALINSLHPAALIPAMPLITRTKQGAANFGPWENVVRAVSYTHLGRVTTYSYSEDGLPTTETPPTGATLITRKHADGTLPVSYTHLQPPLHASQDAPSPAPAGEGDVGTYLSSLQEKAHNGDKAAARELAVHYDVEGRCV